MCHSTSWSVPHMSSSSSLIFQTLIQTLITRKGVRVLYVSILPTNISLSSGRMVEGRAKWHIWRNQSRVTHEVKCLWKTDKAHKLLQNFVSVLRVRINISYRKSYIRNAAALLGLTVNDIKKSHSLECLYVRVTICGWDLFFTSGLSWYGLIYYTDSSLFSVIIYI